MNGQMMGWIDKKTHASARGHGGERSGRGAPLAGERGRGEDDNGTRSLRRICSICVAYARGGSRTDGNEMSKQQGARIQSGC